MAEQIQAQYEELKKIQDQLVTEANNVHQMRLRVSGQVDTLRSGMFVGDAANAFYKEMDGMVLPGIDRLQQALERFSQEVGRVQTALSQAEQNACNRFKI